LAIEKATSGLFKRRVAEPFEVLDERNTIRFAKQIACDVADVP